MEQIECVKTNIFLSELDYRRFEGKFDGSGAQQVAIYLSDTPEKEPPVRCDVETIIGGENAPLYIHLITGSFFRKKDHTTTFTLSELEMCQQIAQKRSAQLLAQLTKLHIGQALDIGAPFAVQET